MLNNGCMYCSTAASSDVGNAAWVYTTRAAWLQACLAFHTRHPPPVNTSPSPFPRAAAASPHRQPLVSFVYERGWRQNFAGAGFPGAEKEFEMAMQYLQPAQGGVLIDASCGTGLFTRLFARSKKFAGVVALDFSESMLQQAQQFFAQDAALKAG